MATSSPAMFGVGQSPITQEYEATPFAHSAYVMFGLGHLPVYSRSSIPYMMRDSRVRFGLWLLKGPIVSKSRFYIDTQNDEIRVFLKKNIARFWRNGIKKLLKNLEWGWSCNEVIYGEEQGQVCYQRLRNIHPMDSLILTQRGVFTGANIKHIRGKGKVPVYRPRILWSIHDREENQFYGCSRLYGAFQPWIEKWSDGGYRDIRRLFAHKYAYDGGTIWYPPGSTRSGPNDTEQLSNKNLAREIMEKARTGGVVAFPHTKGEDGQPLWKRDPPNVPPAPPWLLDYGKVLDDEILEGIGVPPEVAAAEGTGAYGGRAVPQDAFYSILHEIMFDSIMDADEQIFKPLCQHNYDSDEYEIIAFPIEPPQDKDNAQEQPQQMMPGQEDEGNNNQDDGQNGGQFALATDDPSDGRVGPGYAFRNGNRVTVRGQQLTLAGFSLATSVKDRAGKLHGAKGGKNPGRFVGKVDMGTEKTKSSKGKQSLSDAPKSSLEKNVANARAAGIPLKSLGKWELAHFLGKQLTVTRTGKPVPKHIAGAKLGIGPTMKNIRVNMDKDAPYYGLVNDEAGREKQLYNPTHWENTNRENQGAAAEIRNKMDSITEQIKEMIDSEDEKTSDAGTILYLQNVLGIRLGGEPQGKAKHKSYGASTLKASHVKYGTSGNVYLRFVPGKSNGQEKSFFVPDDEPMIAKILLEKKEAAETPHRPLFNVSASHVRKLAKTLDGGKLKTKNFRTIRANTIAEELIGQGRPPRNAKEYKKRQAAVAKAVGDAIGDKPATALKHYIDKHLWAKWKQAANV